MGFCIAHFIASNEAIKLKHKTNSGKYIHKNGQKNAIGTPTDGSTKTLLLSRETTIRYFNISSNSLKEQRD